MAAIFGATFKNSASQHFFQKSSILNQQFLSGCTSHKSVEPPTKADNCETYLSDTNGQWSQKTCATSCDSSVLGCNNNNDIYELFSTNKVSRCHSCHLSQRPGKFTLS